MEEDRLDSVLVPLGLFVFGIYHVWLLVTILHNPRRTVIGLNAESRHQWVFSMMTDPMKNGVLAIQTIRNNIMASTLLATTALTLSSLIGVFVSSTGNSSDTPSQIIYGNKSPVLLSVNFTRQLHSDSIKEDARTCDVESVGQSLENNQSEDFQRHTPLLNG
ncbi:uncharacterized protein LOC107418755 isoform X5 [Ziziphus jujuba]|uniref:Uncharacterized protein LOC107418755 isoform X5 n=1 Tax=Ziziphus jujuba TaxID=326968 RepID=A0ABM3IJ35_ZIZJJ|nr:uncharacterized protein LOC107418755 isoform X5 [Ziziphus jujuba]